MSIVNSNFKDTHSTKTISLEDSYFHESFFTIPAYQRNYSWQSEQIEDFLSSIDTLMSSDDDEDSKLYLGNIIVLNENDQKVYQILDGQQRLTTLFLSVKAIIELFKRITSNPDYSDTISGDIKKEFQDNFCLNKVEEILISKAKRNGLGVNGQTKPRISYKNEKENEKYNNVLNNKDAKNTFSNNYNKILTEFTDIVLNNNLPLQSQLEKLLDLRDIIYNRIILDFTITKDTSSAYSIFESLNTTGLLLTPYDIVSGKINSGLFIGKANNFNTMCADLEASKYNITNLLHYYVQIKRKDATIKKGEIVKYFNNINDDMISNLLTYFLVVTEFKEDHQVLYKLISNYFNRKQLWPIIYGVGLKNAELRKPTFSDDDIKLFRKILLFSVYELNILKHSPGGIYKRIINDYINEISTNGTSTLLNNNCKKMKDYLNDDTNYIEKHNAISAMKELDENVKKAFFVYHYYVNNKSSQLKLDKINLEHIYPQNPDPIWKEKGWSFENDEQEELFTNSFGNMMLLNDKLNKSFSNSYISDKKLKYDSYIDDALKSNLINNVDYGRFELEKTNYIISRESEIINKLLEIEELKLFIKEN